MKRLISILLTAAMLLTMIPVFGSAADKPSTDDVFAAIDASLAVASALRGTMTDARKTQIAKAAVEQLGYETEARGDGCFVFDVDGEPCIYNCRMYSILSEMEPLEGYVDDGQVVTVDYSKRGNGPDGKDVYLIEPFYGTDSSFTKQYQNEAASIAKATGGTYTLYKTSAATIDAVADALESGGVVIFDSHGDTDFAAGYYSDDYVSEANTSYLLLATGSGLTSADKSKATGEFSTYSHAYTSGSGSEKYYYVDGTAITNHMEKDAPNNLVWMAICLGMATSGLEKPFREHGVGVVYGYSQSVTFDGDYDYEATFWTNMKNGEDVATSIAAMKTKHGNWDPGMGCKSYSSAIKNYAAFPIVVSDSDAYPGHGNVDNYQTVTSDWTLFGMPAPSYTVTAVSENPAYGTVELKGNAITATPAEGYEVSGYTVLPANACKVAQNGNTFTLTDITAECTVTVSFRERETVTVTYVCPDGAKCEATTAYVGDAITLPAPEGTPTADRYQYRFFGWSDEAVTETEYAPACFKAGSTLTADKNRTLYAVYSYSCKQGDFATYRLLNASCSDYSGDYVITYNTQRILDASGEQTGTAIGNRDGAVSIGSTGIIADDGCLRNVLDDYVYEISLFDASKLTYSIRMKGSENYLCSTQTTGALTTVSDPSVSGAQWKITFDGKTVNIKNNTTNKLLRYNPTAGLFRCYTSGNQQPLTLYSTGALQTVYTTELLTKCEHQWDESKTDPAPDCTNSGICTYTCALCGETLTTELPALGHDYVDGICSRCGDKDPNSDPPECKHENTETRDAAEPECTKNGYTGDIYCVDCGELIKKGSVIHAPGHQFADGFCTVCGEKDSDAPADPCEGYDDIDRSAWYHTAADFVIGNGLMGSTSADALYFEPMTKVSRAMVASILYRIAGEGEVLEYQGTFTDVAEDVWYTNAIEWCAKNGLASGKGEGIFDPNGLVTRQELAMFFYKLAEYQGKDMTDLADLASYPDADAVPAWASSALAWCVAADVISGKADLEGNATLSPIDTAMRCELASILMRYCEQEL